MSKFAIAVHPVEEMYSGACKDEIQAALDEPGRVSIGINFAQLPGEKSSNLYVSSTIEIETVLPTEADIARAEVGGHFYSIFDPNVFNPYLDGDSELDIVLVGGEFNPPPLLAPGCHLTALLDIKHFVNTNTEGIESAKVRIPFNAIFTIQSRRVKKEDLEHFHRIYSEHAEEYDYDDSQATLVLRRGR